jgi:hypothetical protein
MNFIDFISEGVAKTFDDFDTWSKAVRSLGAKSLVLSANKRKRIAISDITIPLLKKFGEWDEKHEEGVTFSIRLPVRREELSVSSVVPLKESDDVEDQIPYGKNEEIRKLIKKGAMDPDHEWKDALDLVHRAYEVADVERPVPSMRDAWEQYEANLLYSVQMLQKATDKGIRSDSWKSIFNS